MIAISNELRFGFSFAAGYSCGEGDGKMPFLKNAWYVAGFTHEVAEKPVSRRICDQLLVLFRKGDGSVAVLEDRCPHRFVPLSAGWVEGDSIRCVYHGLRFDAAGRCDERPNDDGPMPPQLCVRSFPTAERYGCVWIWMGDAEAADPATIPDFGFIADTEKYDHVFGYLNVKANHELISDNLLDLSHVHYLHPQIKPEDGFEKYQNKVEQDGDTIWSKLWKPGYAPGAFQRSLWGSDSPTADGRSDVRWDAPSYLLATTALTEVGQSIEDGALLPNAHLITPETEYSSHYFWVVGRNTRRGDKELSALLEQVVGDVFLTQDGPVIEAQQRAMGEATDFLAQRPVILKADAAGIRARRVLKRLKDREANGGAVDEALLETAAE
jgi:vanillate O-demethylase monooxygenase subunit